MRDKAKKLAKAGIAKTNALKEQVSGDYADAAAKFSSLSQDFGVVFDANNNILSNATKSDINILKNKVAAIASVLGATFNPDGTLASETYSDHAHSYKDTTIADTADGTGSASTADKTTGGVE